VIQIHASCRPLFLSYNRLENCCMFRVDAERGDHFLQADFSLPISIATWKTGEITLD
jgi:hypothetical protein